MKVRETKNVRKLRGENIGDFTYGTPKVIRYYPGCSLAIGKFCSIATGVTFAFWGRHHVEDITTYPFEYIDGWPDVEASPISGEDIVIGNDVWIANNVLVMQGANVGDGAVLGANSVVAGNVRPYFIAVGNPAREIRRRFNDYEVEMLLEMRWWDWPVDVIKEHLSVICSPDVEKLYETWKSRLR
jgi:acetyltransferase-like isoleucine patch superfamily enzyme